MRPGYFAKRASSVGKTSRYTLLKLRQPEQDAGYQYFAVWYDEAGEDREGCVNMEQDEDVV